MTLSFHKDGDPPGKWIDLGPVKCPVFDDLFAIKPPAQIEVRRSAHAPTCRAFDEPPGNLDRLEAAYFKRQTSLREGARLIRYEPEGFDA